MNGKAGFLVARYERIIIPKRISATTGRDEGVGYGLGLKYALIVAAFVSKVEITQGRGINDVI